MVKHMREAGARVRGWLRSPPNASSAYDRQMAEQLVAQGADVAALTPLQLAE